MLRHPRLLPLLLIAAGFTVLAHVAHAAYPNGAPLCTAFGDQIRPVICSDGAGGAIVAWHDARPGTSNGVIYAQRISAGGVPQWAVDGIPLSTSSDVNDPVIVSDGAGGAFVAYGGSGTHPRAQHVDASGTAQWGPDGVQLSTSTTARELAIIADVGGSGGAIVAWREDSGAGGTSDIDGQKVNAAGTTLWNPLGLPLANANTFNETLPCLLSDGAGGAFVIWITSAGGVRILRVNSVGTAQWSQTPLSSAANNNVPVAVSDGSGGVIVAWSGGGMGGGTSTQRVTSAGTRLWNPPNGVSLSANGTLPAMIGDGAGGAIIAWQDFRSGTNTNLYAQKMTSAGAPVWMTNGAPVCLAPLDQRSPTIASDGATGAIITWYDARSPSEDIYAQRIDSNGAPVWTLDGVPLCTAPNNQEFPTIVADGSGGAFVTWQDLRSGNEDVYVDRVGANGVVLAVPSTSPGAALAARAWPNPSSGPVELSFALRSLAHVRLQIFDAQGRSVRSLGLEDLVAGPHTVAWDGRTDAGRPAGAGLYFLRADGDGVALSIPMVRVN